MLREHATNIVFSASLFLLTLYIAALVVAHVLLPRKIVHVGITKIHRQISSPLRGVVAVLAEEGIIVALPSIAAYRLLLWRRRERHVAATWGAGVGICLWGLLHLLNMAVVPVSYAAGQAACCLSNLVVLPVLKRLRPHIVDILAGHLVAHLLADLPLILG